MKFDLVVVILFSVAILYVSLKLEREDLGCESCFSPDVMDCDDFNSIYVKHTRCGRDDSPRVLKKKLRKLLSFDENNGSWKRCVLWGFLLACLNYVIYGKGGCIDDTNIKKIWLFVISWIISTAILYALKSFETFHIFRVIKIHGFRLVDAMLKHCSR